MACRRGCAWMPDAPGRAVRTHEGVAPADTESAAVLCARCAALEMLLGADCRDADLLAAAQQRLRETLAARAWPFPRPLLRDTLAAAGGRTRFPLLYRSALRSAARTAAPAPATESAGAQGGPAPSDSEDCSSEDEWSSSSSSCSSSSGDESEEDDEEDDEEDGNSALDTHFVGFGKAGCFAAMRAQCEAELRVPALHPLVPAHVRVLARLAARTLPPPAAAALAEDVARPLQQLQALLEPPDGAASPECVPVVRAGTSPAAFRACAAAAIAQIDAHVQAADVVGQLGSFLL